MPNDDETDRPPKRVLTVPFYQSFTDGISMPTADGGRLVFRMTGSRDPADGPPEVSVNALAAVSPLSNREQNDWRDVFALTTAIVDADGRVWEKTRPVSVYEIWSAVMTSSVLYQMHKQVSDDPTYRNAESVLRRVLIEPVNTLADQREHNLVEVIRAVADETGAAAKHSSPYENAERLMFRFRFKYFGAMIGLVEDRPSFRIHNTGQLSCNSRLVVTIHPLTDADMIVALDQHDRILPGTEVRLSDLGPLCCRDARLRSGWEHPTWELPRLGDIAVWQRGFREVGVDPSTKPGFEPNLSIHYEPNRAD